MRGGWGGGGCATAAVTAYRACSTRQWYHVTMGPWDHGTMGPHMCGPPGKVVCACACACGETSDHPFSVHPLPAHRPLPLIGHRPSTVPAVPAACLPLRRESDCVLDLMHVLDFSPNTACCMICAVSSDPVQWVCCGCACPARVPVAVPVRCACPVGAPCEHCHWPLRVPLVRISSLSATSCVV